MLVGGAVFAEEGFFVDRKLVTEIIRVNQMFGKYHLLHELNDINAMLQKCHDKKEEALVLSMSQLLSDLYLQKEEEIVAEGNATTWKEVRKGLNLSQEDESCIALDKQAIKSDILA